MSTREEMIEDAKADAWYEKNARHLCEECGRVGNHHTACPNHPGDEDEIEADDDTEEDV